MMQNLMRRMFANKQMPPEGTPKDEFSKFFDETVKEFEDGGYLESIKFEPLTSDADLTEKLRLHRDELVVVKFWKRGCIPCLAFGEMFKTAEKTLLDEHKPVRFFSVDTQQQSCKDLARFQLVEGTPTILTFHNYRQVGGEIKEPTLASFMTAIGKRMPLAPSSGP